MEHYLSESFSSGLKEAGKLLNAYADSFLMASHEDTTTRDIVSTELHRSATELLEDRISFLPEGYTDSLTEGFRWAASFLHSQAEDVLILTSHHARGPICLELVKLSAFLSTCISPPILDRKSLNKLIRL